MKRVVFDLIRNGVNIVYPDDLSLFEQVVVKGDKVYANYLGNLSLTEDEMQPIPSYTITAAQVISLFTPKEYLNFSTSNVPDVFYYSQQLHFFKDTVSSDDSDYVTWLLKLEELNILEFKGAERILLEGVNL